MQLHPLQPSTARHPPHHSLPALRVRPAPAPPASCWQLSPPAGQGPDAPRLSAVMGGGTCSCLGGVWQPQAPPLPHLGLLQALCGSPHPAPGWGVCFSSATVGHRPLAPILSPPALQHRVCSPLRQHRPSRGPAGRAGLSELRRPSPLYPKAWLWGCWWGPQNPSRASPLGLSGTVTVVWTGVGAASGGEPTPLQPRKEASGRPEEGASLPPAGTAQMGLAGGQEVRGSVYAQPKTPAVECSSQKSSSHSAGRWARPMLPCQPRQRPDSRRPKRNQPGSREADVCRGAPDPSACPAPGWC